MQGWELSVMVEAAAAAASVHLPGSCDEDVDAELKMLLG
jgi:hypothetical protein